ISMGLRFKKSRSTLPEQDSERVKAQRELWREGIGQIDPDRLIFPDESGVTTDMTRRYGRAPGGERVNEGVPVGRWRTPTVLGAVSVSGWVATMTIEAATDGERLPRLPERSALPATETRSDCGHGQPRRTQSGRRQRPHPANRSPGYLSSALLAGLQPH